MRYAVDIDKKTYSVDLPDSFFNGAGRKITVDGKIFDLSVNQMHGIVVLKNEHGVEQMLRMRRVVNETFDGDATSRVSLEMLASAADGMQKVNISFSPDIPGQAQRAKHAASADVIVRSQITGKVLAVDVKTGQVIEQGQTLAIIEAMKMENRIFAAVSGTLISVSIKAGDSVATGKELFKIKQKIEA